MSALYALILILIMPIASADTNNHRQTLIEQQTNDLKKAIAATNKALVQTLNSWSTIDKSNTYTSAYSGLTDSSGLAKYVSQQINSQSAIIKSNEMLTKKLNSLATTLSIMPSELLKQHTQAEHQTVVDIKFNDGSQLKFDINFVKPTNRPVKVTTKASIQGKDKSGNHMPTDIEGLVSYQHGDGGFNRQALSDYFKSQGIAIIFDAQPSNQATHHKTQWQCKGKTCTLNQVSTK